MSENHNSGGSRIDFGRVAADLLANSEELLRQWLPAGRKVGQEWVVGNLANEPGQSCRTNLQTGQGADFATDQKWGDLLALYAEMHGLKQLEAARQLLGHYQLGINGNGHDRGALSTRIEPAAPPTSPPFLRPPADAQPPTGHHSKHGAPESLHLYRDADGLLFAVARYEPADGRKQFSPWAWSEHGWVPKAPPAPRPLYGLADLAARKTAKVLLVEGEKSADAARRLLPGYVVMTWAGGAAAHGKADWAPLAGRDVDLWPDADRPGVRAMRAIGSALVDLCCTVRIIEPTDVADGFDVADAEAIGWSRADVMAWAKARISAFVPAQRSAPIEPPAKQRRTHDADTGALVEQSRGPVSDVPLRVPTETRPVIEVPIDGAEHSPHYWVQHLGLDQNNGGQAYPHQANLSALLIGHDKWSGRIYRDDFKQRIMFDDATRGLREWSDQDDNNLTVWFQRAMRMPKVNQSTVSLAVMAAADAAHRNPLQDWLSALKWDETPRLGEWLTDYLGVARTPYTQAVAHNWLVSMVARAFQPGCQVDTMPVLEGIQGKRKSSALEIIGGEWYSACSTAFGSKDFLQSLQGVWLLEVPDQAGFTRSDHGLIIATVTQRTDRYRPSYGRHARDYPRACVIAATSNTDDYLADTRGIRRFLPLRCAEVGDIDLPELAAQRGELFAEAVHRFKAGASWWEFPQAEFDAEQMARVAQDSWEDRALSYAESSPRGVTAAEILLHAVEKPLHQQEQHHLNRVTRILKKAGYVHTVGKDQDRKSINLWRKPYPL